MKHRVFDITFRVINLVKLEGLSMYALEAAFSKAINEARGTSGPPDYLVQLVKIEKVRLND